MWWEAVASGAGAVIYITLMGLGMASRVGINNLGSVRTLAWVAVGQEDEDQGLGCFRSMLHTHGSGVAKSRLNMCAVKLSLHGQ